MTTEPTEPEPTKVEEAARASKDPVWVRVCQWYFLATCVFSLLAQFLPKSAQEATWIRQPVGLAMVLLLAFATPVTLASTDKDPMTPRGRAAYGVFVVVVFTVMIVVARRSPASAKTEPGPQPETSLSASSTPSASSSTGPYDATWCSFLAYDASTDSFACADERGRRLPTRRGDLPWCPYLVRDQDWHSYQFWCAEKDGRGVLRRRREAGGP